MLLLASVVETRPNYNHNQPVPVRELQPTKFFFVMKSLIILACNMIQSCLYSFPFLPIFWCIFYKYFISVFVLCFLLCSVLLCFIYCCIVCKIFFIGMDRFKCEVATLLIFELSIFISYFFFFIIIIFLVFNVIIIVIIIIF